MITKICNCCKREYPATVEFFHKDSAGKLGLKGKCKLCINGEKYKFVEKGNHLCKSCGRELPFNEKYFVINPKSGNLTSPCKECRGMQFNLPRYKKLIIILDEGFKMCIKCRNIYPSDKSHFLVNSNSKDGFSCRCRICDGTKFLEDVPTIVLDTNEKFCTRCKKVQDKSNFHKDSGKKDSLSTLCKKCRSLSNKSRKTKRNLRLKYRRKHDVNFKIKNSLRCRISAALKGKVKSQKTMHLLGCSITYFINYLENKMSETMNWNNYGTCWHIDHIIPCNNFNLSLEEEQKLCFNYKNMQPMFAEDNLKKQGYSVLQVIYKTSNDYKNNNYTLINNYIIDER